jgi:hypothetical protein
VKPDFVVLFAPTALGTPVTEVAADETEVRVRVQWPDATDDLVFARVRAHV